MKLPKIRIGTRGSKLALYQAHYIESKINQTIPEIETEIVVIKTKGDKILDVALSAIGDKGLFTKELEIALEQHEIDIAVHSLKDMPTELPKGMKLAAVSERATANDILISMQGKNIDQLNSSDIIATSSLRRKACLLHYNPALNIVDIRGNIQTRLQRMNEGHCTAMVLAAAGIERLGLQQHITQYINPQIIIPAVGQGVIAIESLCGNNQLDTIMQQINHLPSWIQITAERSFLKTIEGGCQVPAGCFSQLNDTQITLHAFIASENGKIFIQQQLTGPDTQAETLGANLANRLKDAGGVSILSDIRNSSL